MLVLTRMVDESILIGKDIRITLVRVSGERVRLGISAPKGLNIVREELLSRDPQPKTTDPSRSGNP